MNDGKEGNQGKQAVPMKPQRLPFEMNHGWDDGYRSGREERKGFSYNAKCPVIRPYTSHAQLKRI